MRNSKFKIISILVFIINLLGCSAAGKCDPQQQITPTPSPAPTIAPTPVPPPPVVDIRLEEHRIESNYTEATNNMNYSAYMVSNKSSTPEAISSINISGVSASEFILESDLAKYPSGVTPCTPQSLLSEGVSCEILVKLSNPDSITLTKLTARIDLSIGGQTISTTLSKTSSAYVTGNFSQIYPNPNMLIDGLPPVGTGDCGINHKYACQTVAINLATRKISSLLSADYSVNQLAVGNGVVYAGGLLTSASNGISSVSVPNVGSLILKLNPSDPANGIVDLLAGQPMSAYPNNGVYAMGFNRDKLYIAGNFTSMADINTGGNSFPVIVYDAANKVFNNAFINNFNNADGAITALGFDHNNHLYLSGQYVNLDGIQYPANYYDKFVVNSCNSNDGGASFSCDPNNYAQLDGVNGNNNFSPEPSGVIYQDKQGTLYIGGGFSRVNGSGSNNNQIIVATLGIGATLAGTWNSILNSGEEPNGDISAITPYGAGKYFIGGLFSQIGGINADGQQGQCGADGLSSCLLAQFDGAKWNKIFTTDGMISSFVFTSQIGN
jgi:hypothetical protein